MVGDGSLCWWRGRSPRMIDSPTRPRLRKCLPITPRMWRSRASCILRVLPVLGGLGGSRLAPRGLHQQTGTGRSMPAPDAMGLLTLCCALGGGDSFPARKPDPAHLLATLARAGGQADAAVMLGDHRNDVRAARDAGIPSIFAAWGYGVIGMADGSAWVARDIAEAAAIANRLLPDTGSRIGG